MKITEKGFQLQDISTYRTTLMGLSIIWIVFYHLGLNIPIVHTVFRFGYTGVDIFMFLSGYGLFYSLNKDHNLISFLKKRIIRIFPSYIICGIGFSLFTYHDSLIIYLKKCTTLWFWIDGSTYFEWFIPSILTLYLVYPIIFKVTKNKVYSFCLFAGFLAFAIINTFSIDIMDNYHYLLVYRIPIFILGSVSALITSEKRRVNKNTILIISSVGICIFIILYLINKGRTAYFSTTFLTLAIIFFSIIALKKLPHIKSYGDKIGKASLEIYLIHCIIFLSPIFENWRYRTNYHDITSILIAIFSIIAGITLHNSISKCIK